MSRHYKINGLEYPSVTTIISDCLNKSGPLTQWAANMTVEWIRQNCEPYEAQMQSENDGYFVSEEDLNNARFHFRDVSQDALDIGSVVHKSIEYYLKTGKEPTIDDNNVLSGFVAFLEWKDTVKLEPIEMEMRIVGNCWAGTLDFLGKVNGSIYIIDFKTSRAIYPDDMGPQIAAYRSRTEAVGSGILRLDKETGLPEWKDFSKRYKSDLNIFNKMVALYFARHPRIAKKAGYEEE